MSVETSIVVKAWRDVTEGKGYEVIKIVLKDGRTFFTKIQFPGRNLTIPVQYKCRTARTGYRTKTATFVNDFRHGSVRVFVPVDRHQPRMTYVPESWKSTRAEAEALPELTVDDVFTSPTLLSLLDKKARETPKPEPRGVISLIRKAARRGRK